MASNPNNRDTQADEDVNEIQSMDDELFRFDDQDDYLLGEGRQDVEEHEADLDAEDLFDDNEESGYVVGQRDVEREIEGFSKLGIHNVDQYDPDIIDDDAVYEDDPRARRAAERRMRFESRYKSKLDAMSKGTYQNVWRKIIEMEDSDEDTGAFQRITERIAKRRGKLSTAITEEEIPDLTVLEAAKNILQSPPRDVVVDEQYQQAAITCFRYFIHKFDQKENESSNKPKYYVEKILTMIREDKTLLYISAQHMIQFHCDQLVIWLEFRPNEILPVLYDCLTIEAHRLSPDLYTGRECRVAFYDWPFKTSLRNLRCSELNTMVNVSGVVIRRGAVLPKLRVMYLKCSTCDHSLLDMPVYFSDTQEPVLPKRCPYCQSAGFIVDRIKTAYADYQKIVIQEPPNSVPAGRAPRQRQVILIGDLVDSVKPGELVDILGVYRSRYDLGLNIKHGFPLLHVELEANNSERVEFTRSFDITNDDIATIRALSKDPYIRERLIASISPALWGHKSAKTAICYALFGGVPKGRQEQSKLFSQNMQNNESNVANSGHVIRGDINVLLLGDPGLGKSQLLQFVQKTGLRTIYTTGKGASSVGLTAGVRRDPSTGEWSLEGGALVLADEGICIIDEFDKMTDRDRVSIHEAMEQQSISISKAGIVATLRARCSVIAAANPKFGRYEPSLLFKENVELSDPILSRFDLIIVMRDIPNIEEDYFLSEYVITNHQLLHPMIENVQNYQDRLAFLRSTVLAATSCDPIDQNLLPKYIYYARTRCFPKINEEHYAEISTQLSSFYSKIRQNTTYSGGYPLTLRHIESIIRLAEANARMRLSNVITPLDVDYAISILLESYITSQKFSVSRILSREFSRYRILFRGRDDILGQILRRCIQQNLQRKAIRSRAEGTAAERIDARSTHLPLKLFKMMAKQNKFSEEHVEKWMGSRAFLSNYKVVDRNNQLLIVSNNVEELVS